MTTGFIGSGGVGQSDMVYVTLINLPESVGGAGGGAEAENNRVSLIVHGFDKKDDHAPPPTGKIKVELSVSALPRRAALHAYEAPGMSYAESQS